MRSVEKRKPRVQFTSCRADDVCWRRNVTSTRQCQYFFTVCQYQTVKERVSMVNVRYVIW